MLHKLEKELDDVDVKIGDRWKILDRYSSLELVIVNLGLIITSDNRTFVLWGPHCLSADVRQLLLTNSVFV